MKWHRLALALFTAVLLAPMCVSGASTESGGGEPSAERTRPVALRSGTFTPAPGVAANLMRVARERLHEGKPYLHLIAQRSTFPEPQAWDTWALHGVHWAAYLGDRTWILRVDLEVDGGEELAALLERVRRRVGATALSELRPEDKAPPELLGPTLLLKSQTRSPRRVPVLVTFFRDMPAATVLGLVDGFHVGPGPPEELDEGIWEMRIQRADVRRLVTAEEVQFVEEGPVPALPLMDRTRFETGAEAVQGIGPFFTPPGFAGYSGLGVRVSNSEGLLADHDDFWDHDANGARTTPRWLGCEGPGSRHGGMTAGIILGNGWQSASRGGALYQWRGMAPRALLDCYDHEPDVSNHSFVQSHGSYNTSSVLTDRKIRGNAASNFHPAVGAVANQGITAEYGKEKGYYSVYRNAKNEIIVGNVSATDFQWNLSSLGPTWDGRIKPDLVAPGSRSLFSRDRATVLVDLDYVEITKPGRVERWTFDASSPSWHGGWGEDPWWGRQNAGPVSQFREGATTALRVPLKPPPWGMGFQNRPILGTLTRPDSQTRLQLDGNAGDRVKIRYRADAGGDWPEMFVQLTWASDPSRYKQHRHLRSRLVVDGRWHVVTFDVGADARWAGDTGIDYLNLRFSGPVMPVPGGVNAYGGAGGSSAAAPVVTGAIALLLEQVVDHFGVQLGDHSPSPFRYGLRGQGVPLPSTWKALLVHTARDLAAPLRLWEPSNPDTGGPTIYHDGPDLVTGYGLIDVAEASRLIRAESEAQRTGGPTEPHFIAEAEVDGTQYTIEVGENRRRPLKVTLAWDDPPGALNTSQTTPKLVNDLDLLVIGPDDRFYYPWSIDQPYEPSGGADSPGNVEPEPIKPADIRPARRDRLNRRDNVEQVAVEFPQPGKWRVYVLPGGLGAPPQKYSIVLDSPPPPPSDRLSGGRVAFVSDRADPPQIFVQDVGSSDPPRQVSFGHFPATHPAWSHDGRYLAYVTEDVVVGPDSTTDVVEIVTPEGTIVASLYARVWSGTNRARYPAWSADGRKLVLTTYDKWGERGLTVVELGAPYDFSLERARTYTVVPPGVAPKALDPADAEFSPDGRYVYFGASSGEVAGGLYRIPASGGEPYRIYGNGAPIRRGYQLSVSPDGHRLLYNSELWREDPERYLDEELLEVDLRTGVTVRVTHEPGNEYGWYAQGGSGEFVMQSSKVAGGSNDIYLVDGEDEVRLDLGGPGDGFNDYSPTWWKP